MGLGRFAAAAAAEAGEERDGADYAKKAYSGEDSSKDADANANEGEDTGLCSKGQDDGDDKDEGCGDAD